MIARNLRLNQDRLGDVWHLDEVDVKISGRKYWLWRAVDQHGVVLDEILRRKGDDTRLRNTVARWKARSAPGKQDRLRSPNSVGKILVLIKSMSAAVVHAGFIAQIGSILEQQAITAVTRNRYTCHMPQKDDDDSE